MDCAKAVTTAGTGSETTLAAVITDAETRYKYAINDFPLIPRYAVLDPKVTLSLPPFITATTGMDALTHAVEAYIGNSTTYGTRKDALLAVKLIFENIDTAYSLKTLVQPMRTAPMWRPAAICSTLPSMQDVPSPSPMWDMCTPSPILLAANITFPTALRANAVILPMILEAYGRTIHKKLAQLAREAGVADADMPVDEAAEQFIQAIKDMKKRFGIGDTIPEIRETDIPKLAHYLSGAGADERIGTGTVLPYADERRR